MADTDTDQQDKKGGGVAGVAGGAVGAYAGALGVSHLMGKPEATVVEAAKKSANELRHEHGMKVEDLIKTSPEAVKNHELFTKHNDAKKAFEAADKGYHSNLNAEWNKAIDEAATPAETGKLRLANLNAQAKVLESTKDGAAALEGVKAQIKGVEEAIGKEGFTKADIKTALDSKWAEAFKGKDAERAAAEDLMKGVYVSPKVSEAMGKAAGKEVADKIAAAVPREPVDKLATAVKETGEKWLPVEKALPTAAPLATAEKEAERLAALDAINLEKGWGAKLARPAKIFSHVSGGGKLAIVGGAVALGGATYAGIRAYRNRDSAQQQPESFTDRVDQQKAAPDQSAAR